MGEYRGENRGFFMCRFTTVCIFFEVLSTAIAYQAVMHPITMLSTMLLVKLARIIGGLPSILGLLRKEGHWCAFLSKVSMYLNCW